MADETDTQPSRTVVGMVTPLPAAPPPEEAGFVDAGAIEGEPPTDRKIVLEDDGTELRERITSIAASSDNVLSPASAAPTMVSFAISNALLDPDGKVARDPGGRVLISSVHEFSISMESVGRLGTMAALQLEIDQARRVAAARAQKEFLGARLMQQVLGDRAPLAPPPDPANPPVPPDET